MPIVRPLCAPPAIGWAIGILEDIQRVPLSAVALAIGLTALNYAILSGYDGLAVWYLKQPLKPVSVRWSP